MNKLEFLIKQFNKQCGDLHYEDIPDYLIEDFNDRGCDINCLLFEITEVKQDDGCVDVFIQWEDDYEDLIEIYVCLYDYEFIRWCDDLNIKYKPDYINVIKNERKKPLDYYDRKRLNPTRNNLKLVS